MKRKAAAAVVLAAFTWQAPALAEITLAEKDGWKVSTDGRVNAFISVARGTGIPDGQTDYPGATTKDTKDSNEQLRSTRLRNGFLASILAFKVEKQVLKDLKVAARAALWMNIAGTRTKNTPGAVDPREVYGTLSGSWGTLLGGSALGLFGRGGILVDSEIAHDYGLGYPCLIENASGGACGMAAFGAVFPSFEPGFAYTTPPLGGFELSLGVYDPATVANAELNRAPLPRFEAEAAFSVPETVKVFANAYWQKLEGSLPVNMMRKDIDATAWGAQGGFILTLGPVMVGGAGFMGQAFSPITYIEESPIPFDGEALPRKARGGFGLGAFKFDSINLKVAGGAGVFRLDKTENDPDPLTEGAVNPQLLKQNFGMTLGVYQTTGPVHFALEYFRAEHTLYEFGEADPNNAGVVLIKKPVQVVNFINAGFTIVW
jgi:hypothetical protein